MKRLLLLLCICCVPAPAMAEARQPVAFVALIRDGADQALAAAAAACPEAGFARHGLHEPRFFTETLGNRRVLLCTADLDAEKHGAEAWHDIRKDAALGKWWTSLDAIVVPHPRATPADPWIRCEAICRLRPEVPAPIRGERSSWHASVTGLIGEKEAEYRMLHANVWPGVIDAIGQSGISRFDIFLIDLDEKIYVFSLFEFVGKDFARDTAAMAANPVNRRWWKVTDACQRPLPSAATRKEIWEPMEPAVPALPAANRESPGP